MVDESTSSKLKTYHGNCHCAAFKFSIRVPEITTVTECNCSICFKKAYKWLLPAAGSKYMPITIERGDGTLKKYEFGEKSRAHMFCGTCGTAVMLIGSSGEHKGLNARTLRDLDLASLTIEKFDAKGWKPDYIPPTYQGDEPDIEVANPHLYTGGCHCGAVTMAVKNSGPLKEGAECDCSICARMGPTLTTQTNSALRIGNPEALTRYQFGNKTLYHNICSTCGVKLCSTKAQDPKDDDLAFVNMRCLEGIDWDGLEIKQLHFKDVEPLYVVD